MRSPLISIVIPAYNYAHFLEACVDSVLVQSYKNWELIIVDNGSKDHTQKVLSKYTDPRIQKLKIEVNEGPVKAWALGYQVSKGEYFALLPADDMFTPTKLRKQVAYLSEHPDVNCVGTYIDVVDENGVTTAEKHWMVDWINRPVDYTDLAQWRWKHHFCIPSAIYQKSLCERAGGVPLDGLTNICDWDFHVRLLGAGAHFAVIPELLTRYRWHQTNTSQQRSNAHNQWIYSHTRSFLPAIEAIAADYHSEVRACIEALYLDPRSNYFLEDVPTLWRCAHLEALLNPDKCLSDFSTYANFQRYTESWTVDTGNRAATAALDGVLMRMRSQLINASVAEPATMEAIAYEESPGSKVVTPGGKLKREVRRVYKKIWASVRSPV